MLRYKGLKGCSASICISPLSNSHTHSPRNPAPTLPLRLRTAPLARSHKFSSNMEGNTAPVPAAEEDELVCKKNSSGSIIWRWFGFKRTDEQQANIICRECHKEVISKSGSTSNLFHHLKQRHKLQYEERVKLCGGAAATSAAMPQSKSFTVPQQSTFTVLIYPWCALR